MTIQYQLADQRNKMKRAARNWFLYMEYMNKLELIGCFLRKTYNQKSIIYSVQYVHTDES